MAITSFTLPYGTDSEGGPKYTSPLFQPYLFSVFCGSLVVLHGAYHLSANTVFAGQGDSQARKRSWVLTTIAGAVMSVASLPYLFDLFTHGFDMHAVHPRTAYLADPLAVFFIAYLLSDLTLGFIYYRKLVNVASGWVHHSVYTFLFSFWVHKGWAHLAALGSIFELPTFIMGIGSLYPALRSNNAFSGTFFLTRVFFHLTLLLINGSEHGRHAHGVNGSWGPTICLAVTYPMHLWWGYKCVMSIRRRMLKRRLERKKVQQQQSSVAEGAGAAFLGLPAPDTTSTLNTPAITPVSTPGAVPAIANFGSSGPVHAAFARAAAAAPRPMNFFNARRERNLRQNSSQVARQRPFTAPVAPAGAAADAREPFLDIRSPAETRDRARRLVADAVRKAWASAPESWRKQFALEATASGRRGSSDESGSSSEGESLRPSSGPRDRRAAARRAVMRAVRRAINGRDVENEEEVEAAADELASPNGLDRTLAGLDFSALIDLLPPDFKGQDFEVRPVSVERDVVGGRRKRIVGQIRRRMEVARREVVVFD